MLTVDRYTEMFGDFGGRVAPFTEAIQRALKVSLQISGCLPHARSVIWRHIHGDQLTKGLAIPSPLSGEILMNQPQQLLTTNQLADKLSLRPQTIRKCYSKTGAYLGVKPIKLPNGRLYWPTDAISKLLAGG